MSNAPLPQPSVYAVDSSPNYRTLLQRAFTQYLPHYTLRLFESSDALLQAFDADNRPGLLLLDAHLPRLNGFDTVKRIRQHTSWYYVPVVLMGQTAATADVQACYAAGANSFLVKPASVESLRPLIQSLCFYWFDLNKQVTA